MIVSQYQGNNVAVLAPRENMLSPFDYPNWTELRFGVLYSIVGNFDESDTLGGQEFVAINDVTDYITFGLKDRDPNVHPGQAGSLFVGVRNPTLPPFNDFTIIRNFNPGQGRVVTTASGPNQEMNAFGYNGTVPIDGGLIRGGQQFHGAMYSPDPSDTITWSALYALKFILNNRGLSNQSIDISLASTDSTPGPDYSPARLRDLLTQTTYGVPKNVPWNNAGTPLAIPDACWIRLPFFLNRLRIATMRLVQFQP